jgi:hypothetical protein
MATMPLPPDRWITSVREGDDVGDDHDHIGQLALLIHA